MLALAGVETGTIWISDRELGMRDLLADLVPTAELLAPEELLLRLRQADRPAALVIDGTQLLELSPRLRATVLKLPRVLICTGLSLIGLPPSLADAPNVAILAKPFCVDDLEAAILWLLGSDLPSAVRDELVPRLPQHLVAPVSRRPRVRPPAL